jgi:hypothetical protein
MIKPCGIICSSKRRSVIDSLPGYLSIVSLPRASKLIILWLILGRRDASTCSLSTFNIAVLNSNFNNFRPFIQRTIQLLVPLSSYLHKQGTSKFDCNLDLHTLLSSCPSATYHLEHRRDRNQNRKTTIMSAEPDHAKKAPAKSKVNLK